jgi:integrase/recombinase XerD
MVDMSPLRRMIIMVCNLLPATQRSYIHAVAKFRRHFGRSADRLGLEDVHDYEFHLVSTGFLGCEPVRPAFFLVVSGLKSWVALTTAHALGLRVFEVIDQDRRYRQSCCPRNFSPSYTNRPKG